RAQQERDVLVLGAYTDHRVHGAVGEQHAAALAQQHQRIGEVRQHFARQRTEKGGGGIAQAGARLEEPAAAIAQQEGQQKRRRAQNTHEDPHRRPAAPRQHGGADQEARDDRPQKAAELGKKLLRAVHATLFERGAIITAFVTVQPLRIKPFTSGFVSGPAVSGSERPSARKALASVSVAPSARPGHARQLSGRTTSFTSRVRSGRSVSAGTKTESAPAARYSAARRTVSP